VTNPATRKNKDSTTTSVGFVFEWFCIFVSPKVNAMASPSPIDGRARVRLRTVGKHRNAVGPELVAVADDDVMG
jgi:hypothetical protein